MRDPALVASCHCGQVTIGLPRRPDYVNECNCSWCSKTGSRCMYFASEELSITGEFEDYVRTDIAEPMIRFRRCTQCGVMTHWEPLSAPPHERMGINARLLDPRLLEGVEVRLVDGASWE